MLYGSMKVPIKSITWDNNVPTAVPTAAPTVSTVINNNYNLYYTSNKDYDFNTNNTNNNINTTNNHNQDINYKFEEDDICFSDVLAKARVRQEKINKINEQN